FPDGEDPLGQPIQIDDKTYSVIGVLGRASDFPNARTDVWLLPPPAQISSIALGVIRLRPGATMKSVEAELATLALRLTAAGADSGSRFELKPLSHPQFEYRRFNFALIGAVIAVLIVACSNLANVQLA